jgi:hypothetical protein
METGKFLKLTVVNKKGEHRTVYINRDMVKLMANMGKHTIIDLVGENAPIECTQTISEILAQEKPTPVILVDTEINFKIIPSAGATTHGTPEKPPQI